jgi:hypothetical protein
MQKAQPSTIPFQATRDNSKSCRIQLFNPDTREPGRLRIHVLYTNFRDTHIALKAAVKMSSQLESELALIVPQIVPFPLPLENPPVPLEFASERIRSLAENSPVDLQGYIYLCRNPVDTLIQELPPRSLVVIGARTNWPFGKSKRLARALRRNGHEVIMANG